MTRSLLAISVAATLLSLAFLMSTAARADDSFELMYYDPKLQDFVPGYSIELMKNGSLIGYPRKLSTCTSSPSDPSACTTNMCRLSIQMQAWRACQEAYAHEQRRGLPIQPAPGSNDPSTRPPTGGTATQPPPPSSSDPARCFALASDLLRQRILVLYSPLLSPDQISEALTLIDNDLNALQQGPAHSFQVPCGMHISSADAFPRLTVPRLLRLYIMLQSSSGTNRLRLIAAARLAHEQDIPTRKLSRETWHDCFVQLEYYIFVRGTDADSVGSSLVDLCPVLANRPELRAAADQDLIGTAGL